MTEQTFARRMNTESAMAYLGVKRRTFDADWRPFLTAQREGTGVIWDRTEMDALIASRAKPSKVSQAAIPTVPTDRTQLYRHFDAAGRLLYVGISLSALTRLARHKHGSKWTKEISSVTMEWFNTREEALAAETAAIQSEKPQYNIAKVLREAQAS